MKLTITAALALVLLLPACRVIDLRVDPARTGVDSDALIEGFATVGFADDPSFLRADIFQGRSHGAFFYFELWYLLRLELGVAGLSVGVLPFDVGIGTLFYHPRSPAAPDITQDDDWDFHAPESCADGCPFDEESDEDLDAKSEEIYEEAVDGEGDHEGEHGADTDS